MSTNDRSTSMFSEEMVAVTATNKNCRIDQENPLSLSSAPAVMTLVQHNSRSVEVDDDDRLRREEEESIELARMLMAEEAMASYQNSFHLLQESSHQLSTEDYQALRALLTEDEQRQQAAEDETHNLEDNEGNLSYETMLQLGERIGDVKTERWTYVAARHIAQLPILHFTARRTHDGMVDPNSGSSTITTTTIDNFETKCMVCQHEYEENETLRKLPCTHCFHTECVDEWLKTKDCCPYCRTSIVPDSNFM